MRRVLQYDLVPLLSILLVCAFPCVFLYARNADEVPASSMLPFLCVFLLTSLIILLLVLPYLRNCSRAAFLTDLAMLVVINFGAASGWVESKLPFFWSRYQMILCLAVLLAVFILLLIKKPDLRIACALIAIGFGSVTVINLAAAIPTILRGHQVNEIPADMQASTGISFSGEKPNVYYFLFDEYGGYENLLHYYDYDNSEFLSAMEDRGYSVARESRNTEAVATDTIVPNLLNLNYVVAEEDSGHEKAVYRDNTFLTRMFLENGYQVNLINHVDYLGTGGCRVLTRNQTRRTISEYLMRNSLYSKSETLQHLLDRYFVKDYGANYRDGLDNALEAELSCWQETGDVPTLTIGYVQCPHSPTMVGRHGEKGEYGQGWNWNRPELYLDQVGFISDHILSLADTIREHDPEAVVIFASDHGNRYAIHMRQMGNWKDYDPQKENPYMQNTLSCVYYKGEALDIEGLTGINTMRLVFREALGADLPPVEPRYGFMKYEVDETS